MISPTHLALLCHSKGEEEGQRLFVVYNFILVLVPSVWCWCEALQCSVVAQRGLSPPAANTEPASVAHKILMIIILVYTLHHCHYTAGQNTTIFIKLSSREPLNICCGVVSCSLLM